MMLVLLVPIVVSVTAAPLQQILDDHLIGQSKETLPVSPEVGVDSVKVDSKKPSRKQTPKVNGDSKETKSSQDLLPIPNQDDQFSSFPRTFPVLWENGLPFSKTTKKQPTTGRSSDTVGSNKSQDGIINLQSGTIKSQTGIIKTLSGTTKLQPGTTKSLTGRPVSDKTPPGSIKSQRGTTKYLTERPVSDSPNTGSIKSQSGTTKLQHGTTKSLTGRPVSDETSPGSIKSQSGTTKYLTERPVSDSTNTGSIKSQSGTTNFQPGTNKSSTQGSVADSQNTGIIKSHSGTTKLQPGTIKSSTHGSVADSQNTGTIKSQSGTTNLQPGTKSPPQENDLQEPEVSKMTKKGRKHKAFFLSYPFVPQIHHHYPTLPDYDSNFEDCDFRTEERTPGGKKKYQESNIYYIRLPPTPYMLVPGLGYISQPPRYSPPPLSPHITHVRPMRPARPPTIYQPHVNPFIKVPIDFVSNGKPTSVYQWPSQDGPENRISNLDKGPYFFNGRPSSVNLLRPDGSQTASQNIRYTDYQDNRYY